MSRAPLASEASPVDLAATALAEAEANLNRLRARLAAARSSFAEADRAEREAALVVAQSESKTDDHGYDAAIAERAKADRIVNMLAGDLVPAAEAQVAAAAEIFVQAERTACADQAEVACSAAARALEDRYPKVIAEIEALKALVADADALAATANRGLPDHRREVATVEERVRDAAALPDRVVDEEVIEVWCYAGTTEPVPANQVPDIRLVNPDGASGFRHALPARSMGEGRRVELRHLMKVTIAKAQYWIKGPRLKDMTPPPLKASQFAPQRRVELHEIAGGGSGVVR